MSAEAERELLLSVATEPTMRALATADPRSPSPVTTRLHSYSDTRATGSFPSSSCRKPLLLAAGIVIYGACLLVWWIGGPASALGHFRPLVDGANSLAFMYPQVLDPRVLEPDLVDPQSIHVPRLKCLGWRQTSGCDPNGPREEDRDKDCDSPIEGGTSGYCLLEDQNTGEQVRGVQVNCSSVRMGVRFRCRQAEDMGRMPSELGMVVAQARWDHAVAVQNRTLLRRGDRGAPSEPSRGIVMVVYPKLLVSVHAVVRLLRTEHNCTLPIELWYLQSEMGRAGVDPVATRPILKSLVSDYGPISTHAIVDTRARGFNAKVHALLHSELDQVLFLDADNVPVRNPSFLFTRSAAFNATGAVFWPDFWLPSHTIFNIHAHSLLWQVVDTPFVDMFEQESGQLLVDRRRAEASGALAALEYLAFHRPSHISNLKLAYGDKDLFRLAWMKANAPFHMVPHPPASAGSTVTLPSSKSPVYCGMTMVQFDPDADVDAGADAILFMHRNAKKLTGFESDRLDTAWSHVQLFTYPAALLAPNATDAQRYEHVRSNYRIQIGGMSEVFQRVRSARCYGDRDLKSPHFKLTPVKEVGALRNLEPTLLRFGRQAAGIGILPVLPQSGSH